MIGNTQVTSLWHAAVMRRVLFAIAIAAAATGSSVSAHHSYSAYHVDRLVEVEGVIDDFEWQAPLSLQRRGIQQDTLKPGDRIVITGNPHREFEQNRILNFKSVRRLSDGWKWPN